MSVYSPLGDHLANNDLHEVHLTFDEIAEIIGRPLPASARLPQFWANTAKRYQRKPPNAIAQRLGYKTFLEAGRDRVRFVKA